MFDYAKKIAGHAASSASVAAAHAGSAISAGATQAGSAISAAASHATALSTRCGEFKAPTNKAPIGPPHNCGNKIHLPSSYHECAVCGVMCCAMCERPVAADFVPSDMLADPAASKGKSKLYICQGNCWEVCGRIRAEDFRIANEEYVADKTAQFLEGGGSGTSTGAGSRDFYPKPSAAKADSSRDMAERGLMFTGLVADTLGFSQVGHAVKAAMYVVGGKTVFDLLMSPDVRNLIVPLMSQMKMLKIDKPTDVITLYYLACKHGFVDKCDPGNESDGFKAGQTGVVATGAPLSILDWAGEYIGAANYLYSSVLNSPHEGNEWSEWYLSELVRNDGWKVLRCQNTAQRMPDGSLCPGFALLARDQDTFSQRQGLSGSAGERRKCPKEVMVVIKGSTTGADWGINLDETPVPFSYVATPGAAPVAGHVHGGIYRGAMAVLDLFSLRPALKTFASAGYAIRVTGHSLGGGITTLITAELRRDFLERGLIADVRGVAFAPPACMTENLCEALAMDNTLVAMINREDPVPRLNIFNLMDLVTEMRDFEKEAHILCTEDQNDVKRHSMSLGKGASMTDEKVAAPASAAGVPPSDFVEELNAAARDENPASVRSEKQLNDIKDELAAENTGHRMYVAGTIIYLFENHGLDRAAVISCKHPFLNRMRLSIDRKVGDHKLHNYLTALRSIKTQYNLLSSSSAAPALRASQLMQSHDATGDKGACVVRNEMHGGKYVDCHVCKNPPTWPYVMRGPASASLVAHNCRSCGLVACSVCAPAGDEVPGEGINRTTTLSDGRIALPSIGLFKAQRVCKICYHQSYFL